MIQKQIAFTDSTGAVHATLEAAQAAEVQALFVTASFGVENAKAIAETMMALKDKLLDILTTTPESRPKARRVNGGTKKRNAAPVTVAEARAA